MSRSKEELVDQLIREFRTSGNQDDAFDALARIHAPAEPDAQVRGEWIRA